MRKGYFAFLGFCFVAVAMLPGCASGDPFVINSVNELKGGQVTLMNEYDGLVTEYNTLATAHNKLADKYDATANPEEPTEKASAKPKLPDAYREDKTGAFDDLVKYLKGERPKEDK